MFILPARQKLCDELLPTLKGPRAPITLKLHSQLHTLRCYVGFLAAGYDHYFKAAFHISVGGFLSVLAVLRRAVLVTFQVLGSNLVVPRLIFWALESGGRSELLFHAFGVMPIYLSWHHAPAAVSGKVLLSGAVF